LRLEVPADLTLQPGGKKPFAVRVDAENVAGPVTVRFENLPGGVEIERVVVPAAGGARTAQAVALAGAASGDREVHVIGSAGGVEAEAKIRLTVESAAATVARRFARRLDDSDPATRAAAALDLARLGKESAPAVAQLTGALEDEDSDVRYWAAAALGSAGAQGSKRVRALLGALGDAEPDVRDRAARSLAEIAAAAGAFPPELVDALKDVQSAVRRRAVGSLSRMGPTLRETIPALSAALQDEDESVRREAALALGELGTRAADPQGGARGPPRDRPCGGRRRTRVARCARRPAARPCGCRGARPHRSWHQGGRARVDPGARLR
jgi:HEAT repeat protein